MSDGLVMPPTVVIPELLSIEMHVSFFISSLYYSEGCIHTLHLEVICAVDDIIYGFHFGMAKGRRFKTFVVKGGRSLVGLRVFVWQLVLTQVVSCLPPPCSPSVFQPVVHWEARAVFLKYQALSIPPPPTRPPDGRNRSSLCARLLFKCISAVSSSFSMAECHAQDPWMSRRWMGMERP